MWLARVQEDAAPLSSRARRAGRRREGDLVARQAVRGTAERPRREWLISGPATGPSRLPIST